MQRRRAIPLPINPRKNAWDREVLELVDQGFTYSVIAVRLDLSKGQVIGRAMKAGKSPLDYRRGESPAAKARMERVRRAVRELAGMNQSLERMRKEVLRGKNNRL